MGELISESFIEQNSGVRIQNSGEHPNFAKRYRTDTKSLYKPVSLALFSNETLRVGGSLSKSWRPSLTRRYALAVRYFIIVLSQNPI
ncbi:hypothetical protein NIES4072_15870 [Nostoc commune NIES-4072]|uniref:Uncharacterized protein n=1 Tax=Nostoc commune NIES-4072 TaxID=2005467 RepID=A0A2R5FI73_NOSCO|nr:hypothetical protein NIES4070_10940 [Nostoc commune HK-02]GBG17925.1 hypothetical protein NIES4072_15870 [Nostoc commune NIES-4072]